MEKVNIFPFNFYKIALFYFISTTLNHTTNNKKTISFNAKKKSDRPESRRQGNICL